MKNIVLALLIPCSAAVAFAQAPTPDPIPAAEKPAKSEEAGDAATELTAARKELSILRTRHDEKHSLVQKQVRKVNELRKKAAAGVAEKSTEDKGTQLDAAKKELSTLRQKYTDQHPLVREQLRLIAELERK